MKDKQIVAELRQKFKKIILRKSKPLEITKRKKPFNLIYMITKRMTAMKRQLERKLEKNTIDESQSNMLLF